MLKVALTHNIVLQQMKLRPHVDKFANTAIKSDGSLTEIRHKIWNSLAVKVKLLYLDKLPTVSGLSPYNVPL